MTQFSPVHQFLLAKRRCQRDNLFQIIIITLAAETNRYFMLELGQIVAVCITPYSGKNIIQDKFCTCGEIEDVQHFLFSCARFTAQRQIMLEKVQRHCVPTLNVLLYGERSLNSNTNCIIFKAVQKFITHSKRFEN